jgi:hypothetical protein
LKGRFSGKYSDLRGEELWILYFIFGKSNQEGYDGLEMQLQWTNKRGIESFGGETLESGQFE